MRIILPIIALAAAVAPPALASPAEETVTVRISVGDLDLSSAEGRAAVEARVEAEARAACTVEAKSRYSYGRDLVDEHCVTEARNAALAEADRLAAIGTGGGREIAAN